MSTISAFFLATILSSRLNNEMMVFLMLFSSLLFFVFAQFFKQSLSDYYKNSFYIMHGSVSLLILALLWSLSLSLAILYFVVLFFISLLCPLWIIWLYQYKNSISGPWDLPKIQQHDY